MSILKISKVVEESISSNIPETLSIKGGWGVGKTYFWNHLIKEKKWKINASFTHYAYVSLFGITTLDELKFAIFQNVVDKNSIGESISVKDFKKNAEKLFKNFFPHIIGLPWLKSYSSVIQSISFISIKDTLICLDDFERKGDSLSAKDILGLVSHLKEQRNCKIVLIFNDAGFDEGAEEEYNLFREKVVDVEVEYSPNASEAADIAFLKNNEVDNELEKLSVKLDIKNIRILKKIQKGANIVVPLLKDFEPELTTNALQTLMLFGWCYYSKDGSAPEYEYVTKQGNLFSGPFQEKENKSDSELRWDSIIRNYNFTHADDFDLSLKPLIETGYVDEEVLLEKAKIANDQILANKSEASFSSAWDLYRGTFEDNKEDLLAAMRESLIKNARYISPLNMSSTVHIFRELGLEDDANELIEHYINANEDRTELFNLEENSYLGRITDEVVIKKFNKKYNEINKTESFENVLEKISGQNGWNNSDVEILASANEDQYFQAFKSKKGKTLRAYIETCLQFGKFTNATDDLKTISIKATNALKKIGKENKLNELRVSNYGIKVNE